MFQEYIIRWVEHLNDIDHDMSRIACEKLGKTKDPAVVPYLAKALHHRPLDVRAAAARALGGIDHRSAVLALVDALHDPDPMVSSAAADALGEIGDASAVPALSKVLCDYRIGSNRYSQIHGAFRDVCMAVVQALRHIDTREAQAAIAKYESG